MRQRTGGKCRTAIVRTAPGQRCRGLLQFGAMVLPCALGRSGISSFKREGDGCTPRAAMTVLYAYRAGRLAPRAPLPMHPATARDGWCDQSGHACYNRPVRLPHPARHETLLREDGLYDVCIVLDWNLRERRHGRGSAIFLHLARPGYAPTEGCIALSRRDMARLVPLLRKGMRIVVI